MKVLFATDGSSYAWEAAQYLTQLKIGQPLDVTLLTVSYDPRTATPNSIQPWYPEWIEQETLRVEADHAKLEQLFRQHGMAVTKRRRDGHVATAILDHAKQDKSDLIVIGAQGHSMIGRLLLGSISDNVATHAECSVLVVRPGKRVSPQGFKLAIAYDGSNPSRDAIEEMVDLKWDRETNVILVSIAPVFDYLMGDGLSTAAIENQQEVLESMKSAGEKACQSLASSLPNTRTHVEQSNHVGDAISTAVENDECDLVVIGDAGHHLLHDMFLGSTTKYVLRHAPCSVWISRHHRKSEKESPQDAVGSSAT